ncbi:MAG: hypothetical protein QM737_09005 [Ferruginibacter sp.]
MRHSKYLIIFLIAFFPKQIFAQADKPAEIDITGLWKGTLYHDSTKQFYKYEIAISEEKGKMYGYSHTWYNDSDNHYFVVKKLKIKRKDEKIIIEDVDIVAYNYPGKAVKSVRRLHVLDLENKDSVLTLTGPFSTNRTKTYAPATGMINLQRKNDYRKHSDLVANLQELKLDKELSFVAKDEEIARIEEEKTLTKSQAAISGAPVVTQAPVATTPTVKAPTKKGVNLEPIPVTKAPVAIASTAPAAEVLTRKNVLQETMYFKTDSLELSLYDNGEVDGDTVSVLMNGNVIMAKQGLSTTAIKKTIHIPSDMDSLELVMYAENLGTLPPNSGLLVVHDGRDIYEIRFSGDLHKNATIILKRRKK